MLRYQYKTRLGGDPKRFGFTRNKHQQLGVTMYRITWRGVTYVWGNKRPAVALAEKYIDLMDVIANKPNCICDPNHLEIGGVDPSCAAHVSTSTTKEFS